MCKHSKYFDSFLEFSKRADVVFIFVSYSINSGNIMSRH